MYVCISVYIYVYIYICIYMYIMYVFWDSLTVDCNHLDKAFRPFQRDSTHDGAVHPRCQRRHPFPSPSDTTGV